MLFLYLTTQHPYLCSRGKRSMTICFPGQTVNISCIIYIIHVDVHEVLGPLCSILGEDDDGDCNTALESVI